MLQVGGEAQVDRLLLRDMLNAAVAKSPLLRTLRTPLYVNSLFLVLSTACSALLGFGFWVGAARLYEPEDVGLAAALISAANQLALISGLGLDAGLIRFLPERRGQAQELINSVFTLGVLVAAGAAAIFLVGVPLWAPALDIAQRQPGYILGFLGLVAGLVLQSMVNASFVGSRRGYFVLLQSTFASGLRVVLIAAMAIFFDAFGIFVSWPLSVWAAVMAAMVFLLPRLYRGYRPRLKLTFSAVMPLARYATMNYLLTLFFHAQLYLVPLVVVNRAGAEANAYYSIAMALASVSWVIPLTISLVFVVEGVHQQERLAATLAKGMAMAAGLLAPVIAFLWFGGGILLLAFGSRYSQEGFQALRLLALTAIPVVLIDFYLAVQRVQRRMGGPVLLMALVSTGTMLGAYFLIVPMGIRGAALALLVANSAGGLWALWQLLRTLRERKEGVGEPQTS